MKDIKKKQLRKLQPAWDRERLKEGIVFQDSLAQDNAHIFCPNLTGATFDSDSDSVFCPALSPCILVINKKEKLIRISYTSAEEYNVPSNQNG